MTASGDGWTTAIVSSADLPITVPGPRPGLSPLLAAAARSLVVDGFRIVVFLVGAALLSSVVVTAGFLGLTAIDGGMGWLAALPFESPAYAARELLLVPLQAALYVVMVSVVVGYLGIRMPARMVAGSTVPEPTIRRGVALVGAILLAGLTWVVLPMRLTPVLAVGVTLLPVVFAVAALRGPRRPPIAKGVRRYLLLGTVMLVGSVAGLGFVLSRPGNRLGLVLVR